MKNLALAILFAASLLLGGLYLKQRAIAAQQEARIAELEATLKRKEAVTTKAEDAEKKVRELKSRLSESAGRAAAKSGEVAQLAQQLAEAKTNANPMSGFANLMKSPEMKEMIKAQQKAYIGPMLEKTYGGYFRQLNLNDEQKTYLKDLIAKKMLVGAETGMDMLNGDLDSTKREELVKKITADTAALDAQIKDYLGEENYKDFDAYEKTQLERMTLSQYKDQAGNSETQFSPDQEQQMLQLMAEERKNFKWTTDYSDKSKFNGNMAEMFSEEKMAKLAEERTQLDQKILTRAQPILSPAQYSAYEKFLTAQREMQMMGMKMGAKMFAPKDK